MPFQHHKTAFTLIELLVVIAVIALLIALLVPVLGKAREQGRRVACMGNIRQFMIGIQAYASDHGEHLPSGLSDFKEPEDEHTPILSRAMRSALVEIIGDESSLSCPWLFVAGPGSSPDPLRFSSTLGFSICSRLPPVQIFRPRIPPSALAGRSGWRIRFALPERG